MNRTIAMMLLASIMATGCAKSGIPAGRGKDIRPVASASALTKGETVTDESLGIFKMMAVTGEYAGETGTQPGGVYFNSYVRRTGSLWDLYDTPDATEPVVRTWINGNDIVFWSWYPFDDGVNGTLDFLDPIVPPATGYNTLRFSYTMPEQVAGNDAGCQQDIVFAGNVESRTFEDGSDSITGHTSSNTSYNRNDNQVDIVFHHALSKIRFGVDVSDGTFNRDLTIKSISLGNVLSDADCVFTLPDGFYWKDRNTPLAYSQEYDADFSSCTGASGAPSGWPYDSSSLLNICNNCFFLIPQESDGVTIGISFELDGNTIDKSVTLSDGTEWMADHYYTYKIKAQGGSDGIALAVTLCDWAERENYIPII